MIILGLMMSRIYHLMHFLAEKIVKHYLSIYNITMYRTVLCDLEMLGPIRCKVTVLCFFK